MATLLKSVESKDFVGSNPTLSATSGPPPGLCGSCRHSRVVSTARGSRFFLCELSTVDASFPRYPALPVLSCRGYEPGEPVESAGDGSGLVVGLP